MKDLIINFCVEMILKWIADDKIEEMAQKVQDYLIPLLKDQKAALIQKLKLKAAATGTDVDDAVVHAIDVFLESFIPRDAQCLTGVKRAS